MKQAATIELFSYWDALRAGVDRALLDAPSNESRALLAGTYLVEVDDRRAYPLRVVGATLARLTANARIGASFLECWDSESRPLLETMLRVVHDERVPVVIGAKARRDGDSIVAVECLLLPLLVDPKSKPRILGGVAPIGTVNRRPCPALLEIVSARAMRMALPLRQLPCLPKAPSDEPRLLSHASAPTQGAREQIGRLRVIEGGRL